MGDLSRRQPALDGVRGVAITLVVASHSFEAHYPSGGPVGVAVFFTLSGFLITSLLLDEHDRGWIDVRAFYIRRARRLLPALLVFLAAMVTLRVATLLEAVPPLLYGQNFNRAIIGYDGALGHLWSLSVEEQFYLVAPFALVLATRKMGNRGLLIVTLGALALTTSWRILLYFVAPGPWVYFGPDTNAPLLLAGMALAVGVRVTAWRPPPLLAVVVVGWLVGLGGMFGPTPAMLAASALTVLLIAATLDTPPRWLTVRPLVLLGQRSYGLYLWHWPILSVLWVRLGGGYPALALCLALAWAVTLLSWRYVESPWLRAGGRTNAETVAAGRCG